MTNKKVPVYVWFKFNCYSWNLDKEFIAYMFGYEKRNGEFADYTADYDKTSKDYKELNNYLIWTVNKYGENTMYDISSFDFNGNVPDSIFVQMHAIPDKNLIKWLEERARAFPSFIKNKNRDKTGMFKSLDVMNIEFRDSKNNSLLEEESESMA